jgi:anti-sigma factor ChrR (cupin superfamily)
MFQLPERFNIYQASSATQIMLAALIFVVQYGGDVRKEIDYIVRTLRSQHYPDSYIQGALNHAIAILNG